MWVTIQCCLQRLALPQRRYNLCSPLFEPQTCIFDSFCVRQLYHCVYSVEKKQKKCHSAFKLSEKMMPKQHYYKHQGKSTSPDKNRFCVKKNESNFVCKESIECNRTFSWSLKNLSLDAVWVEPEMQSMQSPRGVCNKIKSQRRGRSLFYRFVH